MRTCNHRHGHGCHGKGEGKRKHHCSMEGKSREWLEEHRDHLKERLAEIEKLLESE